MHHAYNIITIIELSIALKKDFKYNKYTFY